MRSYRDLPIRYADFGRLHRYERSGVTTGLTRVRSFCQDDAHIFCTEEQIETRGAGRSLEMILEVYRTFGFDDVEIELSTRPEKRDRHRTSCGTAPRRRSRRRSSKRGHGLHGQSGRRRLLRPEDRLPRRRTRSGASWQLGTIQLDYQMPRALRPRRTSAADGAEHRAGDDPPRDARLARALHRRS